MKIWFDLTNSPHVNFFAAMIAELKCDHEVMLTCRPLANTIALLDAQRIPYQVVGGHYGKSNAKKALGFPLRVAQLAAVVARASPDVAISHSSFYSPVVSWMLGIPSIYLNDNEHALGNVLSFWCADVVMVPEFLSDDSLRRQHANLSKVIRYPGVKEGVYLWQERFGSQQFSGEPNEERRKKVFIRAEPRTAQYYRGATNFMDDIIVMLGDLADVYVSPRDATQAAYYRTPKFSDVHVLERPVPLAEIAGMCDIFIGAGGTMTREAAVLGIPTISVYQGEPLEVDRYLVERGRMIYLPNPNADAVLGFMKGARARDSDNDLLEKGRRAYRLILDTLLARKTTRMVTKRSCE